MDNGGAERGRVLVRNLVRHLIALGVVLLTCAGPAGAETRVALVIGNGAYRNVPALPNPTNDAADIAAALERLGFAVTRLTDAGFEEMRRALIDFGRRAQGANIAAVFFAGHGMEIGGENWLIPTDAELRTDTDAENEAVSLRAVMLQVANATSLGLVILDACRNNPFAARMQRSVRLRAVERGFSRIEPAENVLVAYAARDGTTAIDGDGHNSPFTAALLRNIETPGLEITFLFRAVRDEVMAATDRRQQPFVYGSLSKVAIYLKPQEGVAEANAPAQIAVVAPPVLRPALADAARPVDPAVVGTWELTVPGSRGAALWIWKIMADGLYRFRSQGPGAVRPHQGTISVGGGRWALHALKGLPGYRDGGPYELHDADTLVMTGRLGTGVWRRAEPSRADDVRSTGERRARGGR